MNLGLIERPSTLEELRSQKVPRLGSHAGLDLFGASAMTALPELIDCPDGAYLTRDRRPVYFYWPLEKQPVGYVDANRAMEMIEAQEVLKLGLRRRMGRQPR